MSVALAGHRNSLIPVVEARQMLARCERLDEAMDLRAKAALIQRYLGERTEEAMDAAEIRLRAERRLGQLLEPDREKRGGHTRKVPQGNFSRKQSASWQAAARIHDDPFELYIVERRHAKLAITLAGLLRLLPDPAETDINANAIRRAVASGEVSEVACSTEDGSCGPLTRRDKTAHIAGLVESLHQSMKLFEAVKSYGLDPLVEHGTKKSLKVLISKIDNVMDWLGSMRAAANRRTQ